jgi:ABC-2 type transport system ATP-binding protein
MNHVITTTDLTMRFRGCDALRNVDLSVDPGTVFALLGETGPARRR